MSWWNRRRREAQPRKQVREAVQRVMAELEGIERPRLSGVQAPEVKLPDIAVPEISLPDLKPPKITPADVALRDVNLPDVKFQLPDAAARLRDADVEIRRRDRRGPLRAAAGVALGAALAYFFDPERGRRRRKETADRLAGAARRFARRARRWERRSVSSVVGLSRRLGAVGPVDIPNDETLAHKVESELFRDPSIQKGRMNVNAENGVVILRGVAESGAQIERIMAATVAIEGVRAVRSLLRTPDEAAGGHADRSPDTRSAGPTRESEDDLDREQAVGVE